MRSVPRKIPCLLSNGLPDSLEAGAGGLESSAPPLDDRPCTYDQWTERIAQEPYDTNGTTPRFTATIIRTGVLDPTLYGRRREV